MKITIRRFNERRPIHGEEITLFKITHPAYCAVVIYPCEKEPEKFRDDYFILVDGCKCQGIKIIKHEENDLYILNDDLKYSFQ